MKNLNSEKAIFSSVGIGTTNSSSSLTVQNSGGTNSYALLVLGGNSTKNKIAGIFDTHIAGTDRSAGALVLKESSSTSSVWLTAYPGASSYINNGGNVGIGTIEPQKTLDVAGTFAISNSKTSYWDFDRDDTNGSLRISDTGTERMCIETAGNVGIGTTNPGSQLSVDSEINELYSNAVPNRSDSIIGIQNTPASEAVNNHASLQFNLNAGTLNHVASISLVSESETLRKGAFAFCIDNGSTRPEAMRIDSAGNVGIGTTGSYARLCVAGDVDGSEDLLHLTTNDTGVTSPQGQGLTFGQSQGKFGKIEGIYNSNSNYSLNFYTSNFDQAEAFDYSANKRYNASPSLSILGNGNVGIGTTGPTTSLTISGSSGTGGIKYMSGTGADVLALDIGFTGGGTGLVVKNTNGNVGIGTTNPSACLEIVGANSTGTFFSAMKLGAGGADFKRVNSNSYPYNHFLFYNGHVGIGTASPDCELSVSGDIRLGTFESTSPSDNKMYYIKSAPYSWTGLQVVTNEIASIGLGSSTSGQDDGLITFSATFNANLGGTLVERARINSNGALCINTTVDAGYKLYVNGAIFGTSGTLASDDRVKHNEQNIVGAIETLGKITPKKYIKTIEMYDADHDFELDADGNPIDESGEPVEHRIEAGVIAQQVLAVEELAFAVSAEGVDEDGVVTSPHGLDYNSLFTYAIAAIQEQQTIIEDLKSRIETLES